MELATYFSQERMTAAGFARALGVPASTVTRILRGERQPGARLVFAIEAATSGAVSRHDLRPDLFGPAPTIPQPPAPEQVQLQDNCA